MGDLFLTYMTARGGLERFDFHPNDREIDLSHRQIKKMSLAPLARCAKLSSLDLSDNLLESLDIWPLMKCTGLTKLTLRHNRLTRIDVTPLFLCPGLTNVDTDRTVEIVAHYDEAISRRRPQPLDELRRHGGVKWMVHGTEQDPMVEIERIKDALFIELAETYCSPDHSCIVDEYLKHNLCEAVEKSLVEEIASAEESGDYQRVYLLQKGLSLMRQ
jgi:hypothetical protein